MGADSALAALLLRNVVPIHRQLGVTVVYMSAVAGSRTKMLLSAESVSKTFQRHGLFGRNNPVKALDRVSFELTRGQSLGVVGESGSGKSTLLRTILKLTPHDSGTLTFDGMDIAEMRSTDIRSLISRHTALVKITILLI